ncbi:AzlD domain-containing protein [Acidimangrovimonas sediminis]|uniref:AzlD domain-containing protein n=1 Tax=Acidimangrovimonas sediminis TaxID=2056283 RepID=UPI000C7FA2B1|nr:AzlD domain-containing protein [Acidimangrovimonas sediminis]
MTMSDGYVWGIIAGLGIGSFLIRFSFLGMIGSRQLPEWLLRHLRYAPVAVLPALVAPLVLWPQATGGEPDPARLTAAAATVLVGLLTRQVLFAILGGAVVLYTMLWLVG